MADRTVFQIGSPIQQEVEVPRLLPVLADGSALELDDVSYTVRHTYLGVATENGDVTLYVLLR